MDEKLLIIIQHNLFLNSKIIIKITNGWKSIILDENLLFWMEIHPFVIFIIILLLKINYVGWKSIQNNGFSSKIKCYKNHQIFNYRRWLLNYRRPNFSFSKSIFENPKGHTHEKLCVRPFEY